MFLFIVLSTGYDSQWSSPVTEELILINKVEGRYKWTTTKRSDSTVR